MQTWHYVAIGAVVVAGVVLYRRRNRKKAESEPERMAREARGALEIRRAQNSAGARGTNRLVPGFGSKEKLEMALKGEDIDKYDKSNADKGYFLEDYTSSTGGKSDAVKGSY